jgi:predicted transcriptional regulator
MNSITIPIPDSVNDEQKEAITAYLTQQVAEIVPERLPLESDPAWRERAIAGIKRGLADVEAGRVYTSEEARQHVANYVKQLFK